MPLSLVQGDIALQGADALVTAANAQLAGGGGVDGAIHRAAGPELLRFIRQLGGCPTGSAVISPAFDLAERGVKYVIHAVGPVWRGGESGEPDLLASAYRRSVELALERGCASLALPSLSTGVYGYRPALAAPVAVRAITDALSGHDLDARLVLFDRESFEVFGRALAAVGE